VERRGREEGTRDKEGGEKEKGVHELHHKVNADGRRQVFSLSLSLSLRGLSESCDLTILSNGSVWPAPRRTLHWKAASGPEQRTPLPC
jgi:hypothetical protein